MNLILFIKRLAIVSALMVSSSFAPSIPSLLAAQQSVANEGRGQDDASLLEECRKRLGGSSGEAFKKTCERMLGNIMGTEAKLDEHIKYLEAQLTERCKDAGEKIFKTVDNVDGIYIHLPEDTPDANFVHYHERERDSFSYVMPTLGRHYRYVEIGPFRHIGSRIEHYPPIPAPGETSGKGAYTVVPQAQASYGFTWKALTSKQEQRQGLHGDEITVFNVKTQEVLATRKIFFYVIQEGLINSSGQGLLVPRGAPRFVTCKNYSPPEEDSFTDRRPRTSYQFVSRVLRPTVMPSAEAVLVFNLARGTGKKESDCVSVTFGPSISPADLELSRNESTDMLIQIANTQDVLRCRHYLHPGQYEHRRKNALFRFYDGTKIMFGDLLIRLPPAATVHIYSVGKGSGTTRRDFCYDATVGPGVTTEDVVYSQVGNALHVGIKNTGDVLICEQFFHPSNTKNFMEHFGLTFYDGTKVQLLEAFQRSHKLPAGAPMALGSPTLPSNPSSNSELHVIGVYEGTAMAGQNSAPWWSKCPQPPTPECHRKYAGQRAQQQVKVHVTYRTKPIILALMAYEPTLWTVDVGEGVVIEKVILAGYGAQQIVGIGEQIPQEVYTHDPSPCPSCRQDPNYFYAYDRSHPRLKEITAKDSTSFQGRYTGAEFSISPTVQKVKQ